MATIDDIKKYVRETPYNTNPNVIDSLLDSLEINTDKVIYEKSVSFLGVEPQQVGDLDFYQIEDSSLINLPITKDTIVYINDNQAEIHIENDYWQAIIENEDFGGIVVGSNSEIGTIGIYIPSNESIPDEYMDINIKIVNPTQQEEEPDIIIATLSENEQTGDLICDKTYEELFTAISNEKKVYFKAHQLGISGMSQDLLYQATIVTSKIIANLHNGTSIIMDVDSITISVPK